MRYAPVLQGEVFADRVVILYRTRVSPRARGNRRSRLEHAGTSREMLPV